MSDIVQAAREQFDRQASHYDAQWNRWTEEPLQWICERCDAGPDGVVLDVATGTGFTALAVAPMVRFVIGADISEGMLAEARRRAGELGVLNVRFDSAAAEELPYESDSFDLVTCRVAPHHFADVAAFLREAERVLAPGRRLLIVDTTVPDGDSSAAEWQNRVERLRDPTHVRNYSLNEWKALISGAGLILEEADARAGRIPLTLEDWLIKSGCTGASAEAVREQFRLAGSTCRSQFDISVRPDGETEFAWQRAALRAVKAQHRP